MNPANLIRRELIQRELARRNYNDYLKLSGDSFWISTRMSVFLADKIQTFLTTETGNAYDILILETPPQHGKSMTITEALPSWYMMKNPEKRVIMVSYNEESAERFSRRNREKLKIWGSLLFSVQPGGLNRATEFELEGHRGRLISRGILSGITGHPADLMIIDDPIKNREEADSPTIRKKIWNEWINTLKSRLSAGAKVILIMTPWHEDDIAARIIQTEKNCELIRLPVEAEAYDPLGRSPGEPLCPELGKNKEWLRQFKESYLNDPHGGGRAWTALYMCRPRAEKGNIIQRDWWHFYNTDISNISKNISYQVISVDAAFKKSETNDCVAITVWGKYNQNYYLLDCQNEHLDFVQTLSAIRKCRQMFPNARAVLIEDKANGSAIINVLQQEMFCIPVEPKGSKIARVYAVSPAIESGHVFLPRSAPWLEDFLNQWAAFPFAQHDDMVDSSSQALHYLFNIRNLSSDVTTVDTSTQDTFYENNNIYDNIYGF